jgi:chaperonin GroES
MLKPLNENVIIEIIEVEKKTASGILLSGAAAVPTHAEGIVVAVGPGRLLENGQRAEMSVVVGDKVIYNSYSQNEVAYDGKKLLITHEGAILAIVEVSE